MGFRQNAWATVWSVEPSAKGSSTKVRLSTSKKNKNGVYEQDFSGFCLFIGDAHNGAAKLAEKEVYNFETSDGSNKTTPQNNSKSKKKPAFDDIVEEGESNEDNLPF